MVAPAPRASPPSTPVLFLSTREYCTWIQHTMYTEDTLLLKISYIPKYYIHVIPQNGQHYMYNIFQRVFMTWSLRTNFHMILTVSWNMQKELTIHLTFAFCVMRCFDIMYVTIYCVYDSVCRFTKLYNNWMTTLAVFTFFFFLFFFSVVEYGVKVCKKGDSEVRLCVSG